MNRRRCTAHSSSTGKPCGLSPAQGATVCHKHGGSAPQVKAKAAERAAEQEFEREMERVLARLDIAPVDNPLAVLAQLAGQAIAFKDALAERVNRLSSIRYQDARGAEQLRSEVALFERALDRCERFVTSMARLKIDDRLARVEEAQVEALLAALDAGLTAVDVDPGRRAEAKAAAARHLRSVETA
jgi:hypothetical protein